MPRLPYPGGDNGQWGQILNDFLSASHAADGTIKSDSVSATQIQDGTITEELLAGPVQTKLNQTAPTWSTLSGKPSIIAAGSSVATARQAIEAAADDAAVIAALPSGSNDTAALQALIDSQTAAGGTVRLRAGKVYIVAGLVMKSGVHLDLNGSTLQLANNTSASVIETLDYATLKSGDSTSGPRDFSITNGTLDGNRSNQSGTPSSFPAILAIYGRRYTLDNLLIANGRGTGIDSQWSTNSPFLGPNGFESFITRVYVHSCSYDGINFRGPHDTYFNNFFIVKCGDEANAVPLRLPDASGRANGSNLTQFHIYGGNGYDYGLLVNTGGLRISNFIVEGAQNSQVLLQASQVMLDGFHLYTGDIAGSTAKGIQFGDASHTGVNGSNIRGNIENCGGGWGDVTYLGWNNHIDITTFFYGDSSTIAQPDLSYAGSLTTRNSIRVHAVDSGSAGVYAPTVASFAQEIGPLQRTRIASDDYRSLAEFQSETGTILYGIDFKGRPYTGAGAGTAPYVELGAAAGTGGSPAATTPGASKDHAGTIQIVTGSSGYSTGTLATLYYTASFSSNTKVVLTPKNAAAAGLRVYVPASSSTLVLTTIDAPAASTTYAWDYIVIG